MWRCKWCSDNFIRLILLLSLFCVTSFPRHYYIVFTFFLLIFVILSRSFVLSLHMRYILKLLLLLFIYLVLTLSLLNFISFIGHLSIIFSIFSLCKCQVMGFFSHLWYSLFSLFIIFFGWNYLCKSNKYMFPQSFFM